MTDLKPLAFSKIESLRRHMLMTKSQMARLLGVSRVTYYNWEKSGGPSMRNLGHTKAMLKEMLRIMTEYDWPMPSVVAMDQDDRLIELQKLIRMV